MASRPPRARFFRPMLPGFKDGIRIPLSFFKLSNLGINLDHENETVAVLKRGCSKWEVKIKGRQLGNGWREFAEEFGVEIGDFLVFEHEGSLVFNIMAFDHSCCEKEHSHCDCDACSTKSPELVSASRPNQIENLKLNRSDLKRKEVNICEQRVGSLKPANPYFISSVNPLNLQQSRLNIPMNFARSNGLNDRSCEMILRDQRQRSWSVWLRHGGSHVYIGRGWRGFCIANDLREGDRFMFELVKNGKKPIMIFQDLKKPSFAPPSKTRKALTAKEGKDRHLDSSLKSEIPAGDESGDSKHCPSFVFKVKPYNGKCLYIPTGFARSNGLSTRNGRILLKDPNHRSWTAALGISNKQQVRVFGAGWRQFYVAIGLKEGDFYNFDLVENRETPIAIIHRVAGYLKIKGPHIRQAFIFKDDLKRKRDTTIFKRRANHNVVDNQAYFFSTITPHCAKNYAMCLPLNFARSNGLEEETCTQITIIDDDERSWPVKLLHSGRRVTIGCGLRNFLTANGFKEGDPFKFEMIMKGTRPVAYFHHYKPSHRRESTPKTEV